MIWQLMQQLTFEHKVLIVLYILTYISAMLIQIKDPKTDVTSMDWLLGFITSIIGGIITYFGVMTWANQGLRMLATIVVSLVSYRTIKFIVSNEAQEAFASGFWNGILRCLERLGNSKTKDNDNGRN